MLDGISDLIGGATDFLGDKLNSVLQDILYATVYKLLYYLDVALCWIVGLFYKMFEVFAGVSEISYKDGPLTRKDYLISYFFHHESIKNVYWDMAMIGIVLCFFFTIIAVIRKAGDLDGKQQKAYGQILRSTLKSVILILLMTAIVTAVITATNTLMSAITTSFNRSDDADRQDSIVYTEDQYAAMARVLNTIGNYSLSTSSTSRYNINACYNEIRPDLQWLKEQGVFDFYYLDTDAEGNSIESWQSALQKIVNAADLRFDLTMDVYNPSVSSAITEVMEIINTDASFRPWSSYERKDIVDTTKTPMDAIMFLMGTSKAANNSAFNENPSLTDNLRGAYYSGDKSIYDLDDVSDDFDIAVGKMDHIIIILGAIKIIFDLATCVLNAVARMFNVLLLYLVAPLAISTSPMDDGGKFKQWTMAFVIQCFGILGIVISMRLLMLYMPIISNSDLQLFDDPILNLLGKLVLLLGGTEAAKRANGLITGILADNAGWQSIQAGDMSQSAQGAMGKILGAAGAVAGGAAGFAADVTGLTSAKQRLSDFWKRTSERGGIPGSIANAVSPSWGQTAEERASERQHDYSERMGWNKSDDGSQGGSSGGPDAGTSGGDFGGQSNQNDNGDYDAKFDSNNHDDELPGNNATVGQINNNGTDIPSDNTPQPDGMDSGIGQMNNNSTDAPSDQMSYDQADTNPLMQYNIKSNEGNITSTAPVGQQNVGGTSANMPTGKQSVPSGTVPGKSTNTSVPGNVGSGRVPTMNQAAHPTKSVPAFTQAQFQSVFGAPKSNPSSAPKSSTGSANPAPKQQSNFNAGAGAPIPPKQSPVSTGTAQKQSADFAKVFGVPKPPQSGNQGGNVGGTNYNKK